MLNNFILNLSAALVFEYVMNAVVLSVDTLDFYDKAIVMTEVSEVISLLHVPSGSVCLLKCLLRGHQRVCRRGFTGRVTDFRALAN